MEDSHGGLCRVGQGASTTEAAEPGLRFLVWDFTLVLHLHWLTDSIGCWQVFEEAQEDDAVFEEYSGLFAKFVADSNVNAQVQLALVSLVDSSAFAGWCVQQAHSQQSLVA